MTKEQLLAVLVERAEARDQELQGLIAGETDFEALCALHEVGRALATLREAALRATSATPEGQT